MSLDFPDSIGAVAADADAVLALELLYRRCEAQFAYDGTQAQFVFGWREPYKQLVRPNRLIWVPGDSSDSVGEIGAPKYPGKQPQRALAGLWERFTIYLMAADVATPRSNDAEIKQYRAARFMLDALVRAMVLSFTLGSQVRIDSATWMTEKTERRFGAGIKLSGAILAVIPDLAVTLAPIDTAALIDQTILDLTETTLVEATEIE